MQELPSTTRQRILDYLREHGEASVRALGQHLSLTATGVRQHLAAFEREGVVKSREQRGRVGRPALVYRLSATGEAMFPKPYDRLALALLESAGRTLAAPERQALIEGAAEPLARPHLPRMEGLSPEDRVREVCLILQEQGVVADWERSGDGFILRERTCPYDGVAAARPEACLIDIALVRRLSGMHVEVVESRAHGGACCTSRLLPAAPGA